MSCDCCTRIESESTLKEEYNTLGFTHVVDSSFKLSQIAYIRLRGIFKQQDHH
jgi:hypothetical protein